jgi:carbon starvation protein
MILLITGVIVAHPPIVAPMVNLAPEGAPPIWPFLFVVIACGAVSGFHSLVSSGTSSKQCNNESDSLFIGYGGMLWESILSALVIVSVAAGIGMGLHGYTGTEAFAEYYSSWSAVSGQGASIKLDAFIYGSANLLESYHIPVAVSMAIMAVFIVSFAGTTVDTATRIQRYVIVELARAFHVKLLTRRQIATIFAVASAAGLAFYNGSGDGALILWPLFGCLNQLLAGLALLIITIYLMRKGIRVIYTVIPMIFLMVMTGWAMILNIKGFYCNPAGTQWLLFGVSVVVFLLEIWMIVESVAVLKKGMPTTERSQTKSV